MLSAFKALFDVLLLTTSVSAALERSNGKLERKCRAVPGSPDWPPLQTWTAFNQSLGGRLLAPPPSAAVCHPEEVTYSTERCAAVQRAWRFHEFHQGDPVSTMWNQFNNFTCLPYAKYSCSPRGYPVYVVNASEVSHIKLGVQFARSNNIRLVVRSTGHDYMGRSNSPFSLSIWTHHLKGFHPMETFQPQNCPSVTYGPAVRLGAGMQMSEIYNNLAPINRTIVGGSGTTVGIAGYVTGGGHSILSPRYGMAADQVLEMEVVTPGGDIVVVNECQNTDLFWALRGGGGSTFGVLSSVTVKAVPSPQMIAFNFFITVPPVEVDDLLGVFTYMASQFPYLSTQNLSGYTYFYPDCPPPKRLDGGTTPVACFFGTFVLQDTTNFTAAMAGITPVMDHIKATWPKVTISVSQLYLPNLAAWFQVYHDGDDAGVNQYLGGRLLNAPALTNDIPRLRKALGDLSSTMVGTAFLVGPPAARDGIPGGGNAVLPAWRRTYAHTLNALLFKPLNRTAHEDALATMNASLVSLRDLAPDMGAYVNEAFLYEPDFEQAFWGEHYERLLKIKRIVDPDDILWCYPCVGGKRWEEADGRLCRM